MRKSTRMRCNGRQQTGQAQSTSNYGREDGSNARQHATKLETHTKASLEHPHLLLMLLMLLRLPTTQHSGRAQPEHTKPTATTTTTKRQRT